jgi:peptidoglycan/LPS O-acetylase OafA/YrhL
MSSEKSEPGTQDPTRTVRAAAAAPRLPAQAGGQTPIKPRNQAIDLLRALCILYIVGFWHLLGYVPTIDGYKNEVTYRLTVVVLGLFVFISGQLIAGAGIHNGADVLSFYRRRLIRLYPPYLLALLLFVPCGLLKAGQFPAAALLVSSFSMDPPRTLWYISMIVVFYLLAPFLLLLLGRLQRNRIGWRADRLLVGAMLIGITVLFGKILDGVVDARLFLYFPCFVVGLLLTPPPPERRLPARTLGSLSIAVLLAVLFSLHHSAPIEESLHAIPLAIFGPLLVFLVAGRWTRNLRLPPLVRLISFASFFMYLFHRPIFWLFTSAPFPGAARPQLAVLLLAALPLIVVVSWQGQLLYDRVVLALGPSSQDGTG